MPRLTLASIATAAPMGAQVYQEEIAARAWGALTSLEPGWSVERVIARSVRSPLPGSVRLPMGSVSRGGANVRRALGGLLYRGSQVVHRFNLELPPAPHCDVITLHDVVAWRFDDESPPVPAAAEEARRAAAVICVSEFSAQEAIDVLGVRNPHVVHNGVNERFFRALPLDDVALAKWGVRRPFVLVAGGASRRKNLEGLAGAWPKIHARRPDLTLVLSGPDHPRRSELFGPLPGVRLVGRVADALVPALMAAAEAVVVPSLYEGFGLPALEGMAAGVPVVAARTSSLPEVVGDAGVLIEPTADDIASGTLWAVSGASEIAAMVERARTRAADFTWAKSAEGHARVWASLA